MWLWCRVGLGLTLATLSLRDAGVQGTGWTGGGGGNSLNGVEFFLGTSAPPGAWLRIQCMEVLCKYLSDK